MSKLLYANFTRLRHDTGFLIGLLAMAAIGLYIPFGSYSMMQRFQQIFQEELKIPLEASFFIYVPFIVIFAAVLCSLFIGTEYSDGTIRNKIMIGHRRADVYLANLIVCVVAECIMCVAYFVTNLCVGIPLLGFFTCGMDRILGYIGCAFVLCAAITAIYTLVAMLNQNKAVTAVICILGSVFMIFWGAYITSRLDEPEVYEGYTYMNPDTGDMIEEETMPNPNYIGGTKRVVYEFLNEFLPGNQTVLLWQGLAVHLWEMSLYSGIITIAVTGFGIFFFRNEDIK